jgi:hypothetical protein
MSERRAVVRSYQRLFSPDRRIYAIDGKTIPVPGGVPLRWLAYACTVLVGALVLAGHHPLVIGAGAAIVYVSAARLGRRGEGVVLAAGTAVVLVAGGLVVGVVDWPLRLVVLPAVAATALTQISPDGRSVHLHLLSLGRLRIAGRRRLGAALPPAGRPRRLALCVAVAADTHRATLGRGRITGPCRLELAEPVLIVRRRWRVVRLVPVAAESKRRGVMVDTLDVAAGDRVEVCP